jgi:hypothetical protein
MLCSISDIDFLERVAFMSQRRSEPVASVTVRRRQGAPAKPAVDARSRVARNGFRPVGSATPEGPADRQSASRPGYLQWAAFMGDATGDSGFGAYFAGEELTGAYTWTPSRRG